MCSLKIDYHDIPDRNTILLKHFLHLFIHGQPAQQPLSLLLYLFSQIQTFVRRKGNTKQKWKQNKVRNHWGKEEHNSIQSCPYSPLFSRSACVNC